MSLEIHRYESYQSSPLMLQKFHMLQKFPFERDKSAL